MVDQATRPPRRDFQCEEEHEMSKMTFKLTRRAAIGVAVSAAILGWTVPAQARVARIVVDTTTAISGQPYQTLTGRAFGELDPNDAHNTLITDINLAPKNSNGKVEYIATFFIVKPVDMSLASGLLWHDVPNRGGRITISSDLRNSHDVGL